MYRLFFDKNKELTRKYYLNVILLIICDSFSVLEPLLLGLVVSHGLEKGNPQVLLGMGIAYLLFVILRVFGCYFFVIRLDSVSEQIENKLRIKVYSKIHDGNKKFFDEFSSGEIYNILVADISHVRQWFSYNIKTIFYSIIHFIVAFIYFCVFSFPLTIFLIFYIFFLFLYSFSFIKKNRCYYKKLRDENKILSQKLQDFIDGNRILKSLNAFERISKAIQKYHQKIQDINLKLQQKRNTFSILINFFTTLIKIFFLIFSAVLFSQGKMNFSTLIVLNGLLVFLSEPFSISNDSINAFQNAKISQKRIKNLLQCSKITPNEGIKKVSTLLQPIVFQNVTVFLDEKYILKNLNIEIKPGETIAFIGTTGCGKSTIANLLERFIEPIEGNILIGDTPIKEYDIHSYRSKIGYVFQEPFLYSDTILNNIFYGVDEKKGDIERLAKLCSLNFVDSFEEKFDTVIGEKGVGLSGGEKQRVSLARALATKPDLLILDDTTSALDIETEKNIIENIYSLKEDLTKIIIAEKIVSVRNADCIFVLNDGVIVESGTHQELLKKKGYYYQIYKIQKEGI